MFIAVRFISLFFLFVCQLIRGLRSLARQHDLFTQMLQHADYMKTFASRRQEIENHLRLSLEKSEASLSTLRKENEDLRVGLAEAKSREESIAGRLQDFVFNYH